MGRRSFGVIFTRFSFWFSVNRSPVGQISSIPGRRGLKFKIFFDWRIGNPFFWAKGGPIMSYKSGCSARGPSHLFFSLDLLEQLWRRLTSLCFTRFFSARKDCPLASFKKDFSVRKDISRKDFCISVQEKTLSSVLKKRHFHQCSRKCCPNCPRESLQDRPGVSCTSLEDEASHASDSALALGFVPVTDLAVAKLAAELAVVPQQVFSA